MNFDLAFPSHTGAIPDDFFPSNETLYGFKVRNSKLEGILKLA